MIFRALVSVSIIAFAVVAALNSNAPAKPKPQSMADMTAGNAAVRLQVNSPAIQ